MRAIIFGAGTLGHQIYHKIRHEFADVALVDNHAPRIESPHRVLPASAVGELEFDRVYIASREGVDSIYAQLTSEFGVDPRKIDRTFLDDAMTAAYLQSVDARRCFLEKFAEYAGFRRLGGQAAEVGVNRGDFAKQINACFPDRRLYLFDTFAGFDRRDLAVDAGVNKSYAQMEKWMKSVGYLSDASVGIVRNKLPHPEQAVFRKGYFPETFDLRDEEFCFVSLDADLYAPTKSGLELFYPRMARGGVILVHDYFSPFLEGVTAAVNEFVLAGAAPAIPVGDGFSLAVLKV